VVAVSGSESAIDLMSNIPIESVSSFDTRWSIRGCVAAHCVFGKIINQPLPISSQARPRLSGLSRLIRRKANNGAFSVPIGTGLRILDLTDFLYASRYPLRSKRP
jgi:hypothetical protein